MRSFRRFTSGESQAAAARFPDFLLAMASPLKKSLQAAERKRADVARARRRWIREQGFLDPAHLVFIDETAVTTNMLRLTESGQICSVGRRKIAKKIAKNK